jgi:hypothetical protein
MEAKKATEAEIDVEVLDLPGVPEDAMIEELPAMKVADVRGCVEAIAAHVSLDPDELLELATYEAGCDARSAAHKKEEVEQEISRKVSERILPDDKRLSGPDAAGVLDLVWGQTDEDLEAEEVQFPAEIPDWAGPDEYMAEWDGWTVSLVRECISAIASTAKEDEEELIEAATERARLDIISAKAAAERVEQDLARMSRERLLPDEKTLEKVSRYEAHLSRLFHKTLHELEALQVRRAGGAAPLARLDVDGLVES